MKRFHVQGLCWETFHTSGAATTYFEPTADTACCGPQAKIAAPTTSACC